MKWDRLVASFTATFGTVATYLWGGTDEVLILLITLMSLDYILGTMCGIREKCLSSEIGFYGILKKVTILIIVAVAVVIDNGTGGQGLIRSMVILFYAGLEGISILENARRMGVPIPEKLNEALIQLREGNKKEVKR